MGVFLVVLLGLFIFGMIKTRNIEDEWKKESAARESKILEAKKDIELLCGKIEAAETLIRESQQKENALLKELEEAELEQIIFIDKVRRWLAAVDEKNTCQLERIMCLVTASNETKNMQIAKERENQQEQRREIHTYKQEIDQKRVVIEANI